MDTRTGQIYEGEELKQRLKRGNLDELVEIDPDDMTEKQRREKRVSLRDHRSKLGKVLTANQRRNRRRKLRS